MNPRPQAISHVAQALMDNAQGYASWWLDGLTQLYDIQCETAKTVLEHQIKQASAIMGASSASDLMGDPVRAFSASMEQALEGMRKSARLMMQMQAELQHLTQRSLTELGQGTGELVSEAVNASKAEATKSRR